MLQSIKHFFQNLGRAQRRSTIRAAFKSGKPLSRFIAKDVVREIMVVNIDELQSGYFVGQTRTNNLLYLSKNLTAKNEFGNPERIQIEHMWNWTGKSWGGLPDGTSIVDHIESSTADPHDDG